MATIYTDVAAKQLDPTAQNMADPIKVFGNLYYAEATYTVGSGDAAADVIRLIRVPANMCVVDTLSTVCSNGVVTTSGVCTLDIGDDDSSTLADTDRYADGVDVAAAGVDFFTAPAAAAQRITPYTTRQTSWLTATIATGSLLNVGQKLVFKVVLASL